MAITSLDGAGGRLRACLDRVRRRARWLLAVWLLGLVPIPWVAAEDARSGAGADTQSDAQAGNIGFMQAARVGDIARLAGLLAAGTDVNGANRNGGTALMYAVLGRQLGSVNLLLEHGVDVDAVAANGWSAIMIAAAKGFDEIAGVLLAAGANPNLADVYGWTPLMRAVYERRIDVVRRFLDHPGTDVNRVGENGFTALHLAIERGLADVATVLLQHGARQDLRDNAGRTAQQLATLSQRPDLVRLFQR